MVTIFSSYEATISSIAIAMVAIVNEVGRKKTCENSEAKLVITALAANAACLRPDNSGNGGYHKSCNVVLRVRTNHISLYGNPADRSDTSKPVASP